MPSNIREQLIEKLHNRTARVGIIGMGYVGLPLAVVFAEAGFEVTGVDPIAWKMDKINHGESYILDVPDEQVARLVKAGKLKGTTDYDKLKKK